MNADATAIKELMNAFDTFRAKWIAKFGDDVGFNDWFTGRVLTLANA